GQVYKVHILNSTNPSLIQLEDSSGNVVAVPSQYRIQLKASPTSTQPLNDSASNTIGAAVSLTVTETLTDAQGHVFDLTGADAYPHILTVQEEGDATGTNPDLSEGLALTYHGALGSYTGSLIDGQTYYVHIPNLADKQILQLTYDSSTNQSGSQLLDP